MVNLCKKKSRNMDTDITHEPVSGNRRHRLLPDEIIIRHYIQLVRNKTVEWISGIPRFWYHRSVIDKRSPREMSHQLKLPQHLRARIVSYHQLNDCRSHLSELKVHWSIVRWWKNQILSQREFFSQCSCLHIKHQPSRLDKFHHHLSFRRVESLLRFSY